MLATALIVFREAIEAGLIVGIVLAATRGTPRRALWIGSGIAAGVVGACLVSVFAGQLSSLYEGSGQELFNAGVLLLAVGMLTWHNVWMASHGRALAEDARRLGREVASGKRPLIAISTICGVAVLREGAEVVLFVYGIAASGGSSRSSLIAGGVLGVLGGVGLCALVYLGLLTVPMRRLFSVTGVLVALLAAGLASQAVAFLQQAGRLEVLTESVWDTSRWLPDDGLPGRLLHTLVGYTDRPSGAQVLAYLAYLALTAALLVAVRRIVHGRAGEPRSPSVGSAGQQTSRAQP
jgi:high-affinity iron transporter